MHFDDLTIDSDFKTKQQPYQTTPLKLNTTRMAHVECSRFTYALLSNDKLWPLNFITQSYNFMGF